MTDAREQVIAGLEAAIRDPHCPLQYSPLLMQAQKLLRAIATPEPTEGQSTIVEAAQMARRRLETFADQANAGRVHYSGRELKRRIWASFAEFDAALRAMPLQDHARPTGRQIVALLDRALVRIAPAAIGSCTCETKNDDLAYHRGDCRARLIELAIRDLADARAAMVAEEGTKSCK